MQIISNVIFSYFFYCFTLLVDIQYIHIYSTYRIMLENCATDVNCAQMTNIVWLFIFAFKFTVKC